MQIHSRVEKDNLSTSNKDEELLKALQQECRHIDEEK